MKTTTTTTAASALGLDLNGNPYVARGQYRTADGKATIEWSLATHRTTGEHLFRSMGNYKGSGGQCLPLIAETYPNDATVQEMAKVSAVYHLNDMHAEDEHQRALGWRDLAAKRLTLVSYGAPTLKAGDVYPAQSSLEHFLKGWVVVGYRTGGTTPGDLIGTGRVRKVHIGSAGEGVNASGFDYRRVIAAIYREHVSKPANANDPRSEWFAQQFGCKRTEKTERAGSVYPTEHPEGLLTKACPVCGYRYGSEWKTLPIPADVVAQITNWSARDNTGGVSGYEATAQAFLDRHGVSLRITKADSKPAPFAGEDGKSGHHYRITLSRKGKTGRVAFDYWGSIADAEKGKEPGAYDVLACISGDINIPETFADYCSEYGEDSDSIKARQTWKRCDSFARRLRAFFASETEREELAQIN